MVDCGNLVSKWSSGMLCGVKLGLLTADVSEFGIAECEAQNHPAVLHSVVKRRSVDASRQKVHKTAAPTGNGISPNVRKFGIVETWFPHLKKMETKFPLEA